MLSRDVSLLRSLLTLACIAAATAVAAEPVPLSSDAIKKTVSGALLEFDTPVGSKIPVRFATNGLVSGEAGELASYLGAARDRGRWWTAGDRLCVKWFRWFSSEVRCVDVRQDSTQLYWRTQDGKSGTAKITEAAIVVAVAKPAPHSGSAATHETNAQAAAVANLGAMRFAGIPLSSEPAPEMDPVKPTPSEAAQEHPSATVAPAPPRKIPPRVARRADPPPAQRELPRSKTSSTVMAVSFRVAGVDSSDVLNVRSGPSEDAEAVGDIPAEGRGVIITGQCQYSWCPVRHGRVSGWVNRYFLAEESPGRAGPSLDR
jgi:Bacterial SH3 domain